jgi:hypothetical protein
VECVGDFIVACFFKNVEDQFTWAFVGVYGPNSNSDRMFLWDELVELLSWWNLPWRIGETSMSIVFLERDPMKPVVVQLYRSSHISFFIGSYRLLHYLLKTPTSTHTTRFGFHHRSPQSLALRCKRHNHFPIRAWLT